METRSLRRRRRLNTKGPSLNMQNRWIVTPPCWLAFDADPARGQNPPPPASITLDQAIEIAMRQNHNLLATRTTVQQNQAQEVTANLRPNPTLFTDWEYLPLPGVHPDAGLAGYLHDSTEGDVGLSYLFERGKKRQHRLKAAQDATAVTRSTVVDNERTLTYQVTGLFINVQLAQSTLDLAQQDLKSFQSTVDISQSQFNAGGMSENDYLKIKLQLLQFQQDVDQAQLAKAQALSDLRQQLGYESVAPEYDVAGPFDYQPLTLRDLAKTLQMKALANRPDLRGTRNSALPRPAANTNWPRSMESRMSAFLDQLLPPRERDQRRHLFDQHAASDIRPQPGRNCADRDLLCRKRSSNRRPREARCLPDVKDAYEGLVEGDRIAQYFRTGYLEAAQRSRDISEYSFRRGATRPCSTNSTPSVLTGQPSLLTLRPTPIICRRWNSFAKR